MKWFIQALKKYAVFDGRAQRKEYWMFFLFSMIFAFAIGLVLGVIELTLEIGTALSDPASIIYNLVMLVPSFAVGARRMHDLGRSGWWILFPLVNLVFLCLDSEPGENKYGPNPKGSLIMQPNWA